MLDQWALALMALSGTALTVITMAVIVAAFLLAILVHRRSTRELVRAPYFALEMGLVFLTSLLSFLWLLSFEALANGVYWTLPAAQFLGMAGVGYASGRLAVARSVNAYGNWRRAWLGVVPIANLFLMFAPPANEPSRRPAPSAATMGLVVLGFVLLIGSRAAGYTADREITRMADGGDKYENLGVAVLKASIAKIGLPSVLEEVAASAKPVRIDDTAELERLEADGTTLRYWYTVAWDGPGLPADLAGALAEDNCGNPTTRLLLEAGARLEHIFRRTDLTTLGTVTVVLAHCAGA